MILADCFNQSAPPLGKQVASHLLRLTAFVKLGVERIAWNFYYFIK
ncbi:hypothetical protein HMPREF9225_0895 [Peptoniphilus duerdenii ATCC BAA-1640]|uniref:Uncharacterized protein n=1 Tax=Peptoniphilus duerdenii ATCC BAA-1640 TaxID=862517 RepID=E0NL56_9FIRM|nr:hypothetical protein HMPREF9225_0895 [Peptoniphilus duerdenii ATCC BAA-1640]